MSWNFAGIGSKGIGVKQMHRSKSKVIDAIEACLGIPPITKFDWYIGLAEDPRERLFDYHEVDENGVGWTYAEAEG